MGLQYFLRDSLDVIFVRGGNLVFNWLQYFLRDSLDVIVVRGGFRV
jgi:hypothetical protein